MRKTFHAGSATALVSRWSLTLIEEIEKPSWQDVLRNKSDECPGWYRETIELDDRRFWDEAMGEGFSDWYDWQHTSWH